MLKTQISGVVVASPDEPVAAALDRMAAANVGSILVVNDGRPVGILTERDVLRHWRRLGDAAFRERAVKAIATKPVFTLGIESIADAAREMVERHIRHIPLVAADGRIVGIMSMRDLVSAQVKSGSTPEYKAASRRSKAIAALPTCMMHVLTPTAQLEELVKRFLPGNWQTRIWLSARSIENLPELKAGAKLRYTAFMLDLDGVAEGNWKPLIKKFIKLLATEEQPVIHLVSSPSHFPLDELRSLRAVAAKARWRVYQRPLPVASLVEDLRGINTSMLGSKEGA